MAELTLEEQIKNVIIKTIRDILEYLSSDRIVTINTQLDEIGIDRLDMLAVEEALVEAGLIDEGFEFNDSIASAPEQWMNFDLKCSVSDLVKQVLEEVKKPQISPRRTNDRP